MTKWTEPPCSHVWIYSLGRFVCKYCYESTRPFRRWQWWGCKR